MKTKQIKREAFAPASLYIREQADGSESRGIEGYAILFNTPSAVMWTTGDGSEVREVIDPSAVQRELLDASDIKMTMFHDRQLILARSNQGKGTLSYEIDEKGVKFSFDAPQTADGDKALELVKRGDIAGCSFAFSTYYNDREYVEKEVASDGNITYRVKALTGVYDFTLAADPAYPDTECNLREIMEEKPEKPGVSNDYIIAMRREAQKKID